MGGDEFVVYLKNVNDEKVLQYKANFLNEQILIAAKKLLGDDMDIPLGVSVGAVFAPDEGEDFQTLYKKADSALYTTKQHGKHGLTIYGTNRHAAPQVDGISQTRMILGERDNSHGAYFVNFEQFKVIYRMLMRMANVWKKGVQLMQMTADDDFKETLLNSLRNSDCVTQNGNKYLILLLEVTSDDAETIKNRLFGGKTNFNCEIERII